MSSCAQDDDSDRGEDQDDVPSFVVAVTPGDEVKKRVRARARERERRLSTERGREDEAIADEIEVRHVAAGHWRARGGR